MRENRSLDHVYNTKAPTVDQLRAADDPSLLAKPGFETRRAGEIGLVKPERYAGVPLGEAKELMEGVSFKERIWD